MKNHRKKEKKEHIFLSLLLKTLIVFIISTSSIVLYDMYANINIEEYDYSSEKLSKEISTENSIDISTTLEDATKSVVGISKIDANDTSIFSINSPVTLSLGSGIIVTDDGYILTNEHVTGEKYSKCYVTLESGEEYAGTVIWADSDIDLSIVKIESRGGVIPLSLGNSDEIRIGQTVYAIGNPIGLEFQSTVTSGIISAVDRTIKIKEEDNLSYMEDLIQTDATINEGNSGGPLINEKGEVIGINAVKIEEGSHLGFAIPINIVKPIIEKIKNTGNFVESSIGIYAYDKEVIQYLEENLKFDSGIYVVSINKTGASYGKGLLKGDIITKIDDVTLNKMSDLRKYIYTKEVGDEVVLTILRNKKTIEIPIVLKKK